jgi:hypothetical protein
MGTRLNARAPERTGHPRTMLRPWWALAAVVLVAGCTLLDPNVGTEQDNCGGAGPSMTGSSGGSPYMPSQGAQTTEGVCWADAGSACDDCESAWCCTQHIACYSDAVCFCADHQLDGCEEAAGADTAAIASCWSAFGSRGKVEAARLMCLQAWCASECGTP